MGGYAPQKAYIVQLILFACEWNIVFRFFLRNASPALPYMNWTFVMWSCLTIQLATFIVLQLWRTHSSLGLEEHVKAIKRHRYWWWHLAAEVGTRKWQSSAGCVHAQRIPHSWCGQLWNRFVGSLQWGQGKWFCGIVWKWPREKQVLWNYLTVANGNGLIWLLEWGQGNWFMWLFKMGQGGNRFM